MRGVYTNPPPSVHARRTRPRLRHPVGDHQGEQDPRRRSRRRAPPSPQPPTRLGMRAIATCSLRLSSANRRSTVAALTCSNLARTSGCKLIAPNFNQHRQLVTTAPHTGRLPHIYTGWSWCSTAGTWIGRRGTTTILTRCPSCQQYTAPSSAASNRMRAGTPASSRASLTCARHRKPHPVPSVGQGRSCGFSMSQCATLASPSACDRLAA